MKRNARALLGALIVTVGLVAAVAPAGAALPTNPTANKAIGSLPASCQAAPQGATCNDAVVAALDAARATVGLGPYALPANFDALPGTRQIFILANLDRIAYGLAPISGIAPSLAASAQAAIVSDADPNPTRVLARLPHYVWTSNWAGGWFNAAYAYYEWMYDDGYNGSETSNVDCTGPSAGGCWDHRNNVLAFHQSGTIVMGAAIARDTHGQTGYAITLVWTPTNWTHCSYSWGTAQTAGAGR